ncbi:MAG: GNAT family N-acetyltransferase [Bacteroidota bacterium]
MESIIIREIKKEDNPFIAQVIRSVLIDLNVPKVGTAYADPQLDFMFEAYAIAKAAYFVVESNGKIIGGAGIGHLETDEGGICELQKMYFLPEARGLGIGSKMMDKCLQSATGFGYEKCYLETMPYMEAAQKLYKKSGFEYLCEPMGNTGHTNCPVWMLKDL